MKRSFSVSRRGFVAGLAALGASAVAVTATEKMGNPESAWADEETNAAALPKVFGEEHADGDIVNVDLVVVGTGIAGLYAAIKASENGVRSIALVDKGAIGLSSVSSMISGGTAYIVPDEGITPDEVLVEQVRGAGYFNRQDLLKDMWESSADLYRENIEDLGLSYKARAHANGNKYTTISRGCSWNGFTHGRAVVSALLSKVQQMDGMRYFSKTMVTEVLKDSGGAAGIVGFNRVTGNTLAITAKVVIIATGQCTFSGQHAMGEVYTGDGYQLAYNAGGTLANMEFWAFDFDPVGYGFEGSMMLEPYGANLVNKYNHEFMWDVDPANGSTADYPLIIRAMAEEVKAGRGPVYMDRTTYQYILQGQFVWRASLAAGSWRRINDLRMPKVGHDVMLEPEVYTASSFGIVGAIKTDIDLQTDVPGLFCASIAISQDIGKLNGVESARAMWSGRKAGAASAAYAASAKAPRLSEDYLRERMAATMEPLAASAQLDPEQIAAPSDILWQLQEIIMDYNVSLLPNESTLTKALEQVRNLKRCAEEAMLPTDPHETAKYYETRNMLNNAELHLIASLDRKESRKCHIREDYPEIDNENWLKWIEFKKGADGEPDKSYCDIPFDTYPIQPE